MKSFEKIFFSAVQFLFFIYGYALGNIHYITQAGGGGAMSAAQFNALSGDRSGHTFYFSGTISTQLVINIHGSSNNPVTLDGWADGACNPTENGTCAGAATLTGGVNQLNSGNSHTRHLIMQDFNITGGQVLFNWFSRHTPPNNIIVRRNNFSNANHMLISFGSPDYVGFAEYITIENNRFNNYGLSHDVSGGMSFQRMREFIIRGNRFTGHTGITTSSNYIELHNSERVLLEYNWFDPTYNAANINGASLAAKESGSGNQDIIFRFNKTTFTLLNRYRDFTNVAFNWFVSSGFYAYGNYIYCDGGSGSAKGFMFFDGADNINVWSNIVSNNSQYGSATWWQPGRGLYGNPGTKRLSNLRFYNNTFYGNASDNDGHAFRSGVSFADGGETNLFVKNNIFMNNRPNNSDRRQINDDSSRITQLEHNTYYHIGGEPTVRRAGADRTIAVLKSSYGLENAYPAGSVANPGLVNPSANDYRLNGTHVDNGANLSGVAGEFTIQSITYTMRWETALHPNTDWSGQPSPSKIITANQNEHGSSWERGAYVFADKVNHLNSPNNLRISNHF